MSLRPFAIAVASSISVAGFAQNVSDETVITAPAVQVEESRLRTANLTTTRVELEREAIRTDAIKTVADDATNFFLSESGARSFTNTVTLRGLSNTPLFGDPSVGVYVDELPLGNVFTFPTELAGLGSADLVRGLRHNVLAGRVGSAGLLRLNTPPAENASSRASVTFGNHSSRTAQVSHGASAGGVDVYASGAYSARDGYIENRTLGRDVDWRESTSGLVKVTGRPSDSTELSFLAYGQHVRDGVQALVPLDGPFFEVERSAEGTTPLDSFGFALRAAAELPFGGISATTSFTDFDLGTASNVLGLGFAELANQTDYEQRNWTEEIRVHSAPGSTVAWSAGVYGLDGRMAGAFTREIFGTPFESSTFRIKHRSLAAFADVSLPITQQLRLLGGARVEGNWKSILRNETVPTVNTYERDTTSSALLPHLGIAYRFDEQTEITASVGASYKPGGFSAFTGNRALSRFGPERTEGIDVAVTHHAANRVFSATVRGFAYNVDGFQIERSFQTGGMADDYLVVNADRARSLGGEVELSWRPLQGLRIDAAAGYTDVTLRRFSDPFSGASYDGNEAPFAPNHELNLAIEYRHSSGVFVAGRANQVGRTRYTESEEQMFSQGSYTVFALRVGYARERFEVSVFGENLTDREYYTSILPGTFHGTPGAPRTYGVQAGVNF